MLKKLFPSAVVVQGTAGERAGRHFDRGDNCAQSVLKATTGRTDPELLEIAKSFGAGIAGAKCLCGTVSGGVMALSLRGKGKQSDQLVAAFKSRHRTTCCAALSKPYRWNGPEHVQNCRDLTVSVAEIVEQMLLEVDPR